MSGEAERAAAIRMEWAIEQDMIANRFDPTTGEPFAADACSCLLNCDEDPESACSLAGQWHVHPSQFLWDGLGPCPVHPETLGDV